MANAAAVEIALGLSGVSEVTRGLGTVESGIGRLAGLGGNVGGALLGGVGALATGIGIVGTAAAGAGVALTGFVVGPAMDFQQEISAIGAVAGLAGPQLDAVSALALQLGKDTAFSASEAAQGIEELVKGGVSIPDIMNGGAAAMLNLAAAGGVALPQAAEISANAMAMFGLHGSDMAHVADLIAGAANASTISVSDFQFSLSAAGAMAALTGQSFDSLATTIALLGSKGMKGQDAGTSIKSFLGALTPSTKQAQEALKSLGLYTYGPGVVDPASQAAAQKADAAFAQQQQQRATRLASLQQDLVDLQAKKKIDPTAVRHKQEEIAALQTEMATATSKAGAVKMTASGGKSAFVDEKGNFLDMVQIIDKLHKATDGLSESQKSATLEAIFGSDAIRVAAILADEGADGYNAMAAAMGNVTAADVAGKRLDNLAGDIEQLKGSAETARIAIGLQLLPVFRQLAQGATGLINGALPKIDQFFKSFKAALGGDMGTDLGSRVALGFILIRDTVTNRVLPAVRLLWAQISGAAGGVNPLGIIMGVANAAETVGRWFQLGVDAVITFRQALAGVWTLNGGGNDLVNMVGRIGLAFRSLDRAFQSGGVGGALQTLWTGYVQPALGDLWMGLVRWIRTNGPSILRTLGLWASAFGGWAHTLWDTVIAPNLGAFFSELGAWIRGTVLPYLQTNLPIWGQAFAAWASNIWTTFIAPGLGTMFSALGGWIQGTVLPYLEQHLPVWGGAFAAWATDLWQNHLAPGLGTLFDSLGTWMSGTVLPYLEQNLPKWGAAFADWASKVWTNNIEPGMGQLWTNLSTWITSTAPVIGKQALAWGAALVAGMWEGFAGHDTRPQTNLGQGILGTLNGVDPADTGAATGLMAYLNGINTSIDTWAATTGHEAMGRALRTILTSGPSVEDVGNAALNDAQKLLGSGPTVKEVGDQAIVWFNALADYLAVQVPQLATWDNMWTAIADGISSGMPQWLRDFLHISPSPHSAVNGAITEGGGAPTSTPNGGGENIITTPAFGTGLNGGATSTSAASTPRFDTRAFTFGNQGGGTGQVNLTVNFNSPITATDVAQSIAGQIYDALAPLLGESGGGGGATPAPATTGAVVF